jgi:hypothetical protein
MTTTYYLTSQQNATRFTTHHAALDAAVKLARNYPGKRIAVIDSGFGFVAMVGKLAVACRSVTF